MNEWKTVKIGEICEQINGVSYKPADVYDSLTEKTTILLRANNIFEDKLNYDELVFVDKKRISENQYMKKGDILICASSGSKHLVGKAACLTEDKDLTFGAFCKVLRPKTVNSEYIKHYFFSPSYRTEISRLSEGANINNIKAADLDNLKIPLPSKSIQNKIAKQLDKCVKIINNQKKALEKYDTLIKSRFIEMFGDIRNQEKYKGIPLSNLCKTMTGGTPPTSKPEYYEGTIPWITTVSLGPNHIDGKNAKGYITEEAIKNSATKLIPVGNILFGTRVGVGKSSINDVDICTNQDIIALIGIDESRYSKLFIKHVLDQYQPYFDSIKKGATILGITTDDVKKSLIPDVSLSLQKEFENFVQQIDKSKFAVQKALEKAETLYKSLMQLYFA